MDWNTDTDGAEGFNINGSATSGKKVSDIDNYLRNLAQAIRVRLDGILSWNDSTEQALPLKQTESKVSAYASTVMSVADSTWTTITLDTETFDNLNEFTNSKFTAKTSGYYQVCGQIGLETIADGKNVSINIQKNGSFEVIANTTTGVASDVYLPVSKLIYLSINDYIQLAVYHTHGSARNIKAANNKTFLTMHRIS